MTIREKINAILGKHPEIKLTVVELKMNAKAALEDGSEIHTTADAFAMGVDVYKMDEAGNPVPCEPGEYTLSDGTKITVDDKHMVSAITEAAAPDMSTEEMAKVIEDLAAQLSEAKAENTALTTERDTLKTEAETHKMSAANLQTKLSALEKKAAAVSVTDVAKTIEMKKKEEKTEEPVTTHDKIKAALAVTLSKN